MTLDNDRQFAAALAACCARVQRGESLEGCLNDYPAAYRDELRRLVPLGARVAAVGSAPAPGP